MARATLKQAIFPTGKNSMRHLWSRQEPKDYEQPPFATFADPFGPQPKSKNPDVYSLKPTLLHISHNSGGPPSLADKEQYTVSNALSNSSAPPLFAVRGFGRLASAHNKRTFVDAQGTELFTLETRLMSLHETFHAESHLGQEYGFEIKREYDGDGSESTLTFINAEDAEIVEVKVRADHLGPYLWLMFGAQRVARIRRMADVSEIVSRVKTERRLEYEVSVAANVDLSLVAGVCVCLEGLKYGKT